MRLPVPPPTTTHPHPHLPSPPLTPLICGTECIVHLTRAAAWLCRTAMSESMRRKHRENQNPPVRSENGHMMHRGKNGNSTKQSGSCKRCNDLGNKSPAQKKCRQRTKNGVKERPEGTYSEKSSKWHKEFKGGWPATQHMDDQWRCYLCWNMP